MPAISLLALVVPAVLFMREAIGVVWRWLLTMIREGRRRKRARNLSAQARPLLSDEHGTASTTARDRR